MTEEIARINEQRTYWQHKLRMQLTDLMFCSLEGDKKRHEMLMDDIETSIIILWRFDRRLDVYSRAND